MNISEDLLKKCINGDQIACKGLYNLLAGKLFATCLRYTKNRTEAEDWLQESFIKIFTNLQSFKFEGSFEGWARRITVNHIISNFKKNRKHQLLLDIETVSEPLLEVELSASTIQYDELISFINLLPEGKKMVFNLYVIEGYSHKEIGELLNINEGTSRGQLAKAKELLVEIHKKYNRINAEKVS